MKKSRLTRKEWYTIIIIVFCLLAILYLIGFDSDGLNKISYKLPTNKEFRLIFACSVLVGCIAYFSGKMIGVNKNRDGVLNFLKILLPSSASIIAGIWLLSTGYLNVKAENLKKGNIELKEQFTTLQKSISQFKKDSVQIRKEIKLIRPTLDSLKKINSEFIKNNKSLISTITQRQSTISKQDKVIKNLRTLAKNSDKPILRMTDFDRLSKKVEIKLKCYDANLISINSKLKLDVKSSAGHDLDKWYYNDKIDYYKIIPYNDEDSYNKDLFWNSNVHIIIKIHNKKHIISVPYLTASYDIILQDFSS